VRVSIDGRKPGPLATSLKAYVKNNDYGSRVEVRSASGDVYLLALTHADVINAKKGVSQ